MARTKSRPATLSEDDRAWLTTRIRTGSFPAQEVHRAWILLELDERHPDRPSHDEPVPTQVKVAELAGVHVDTMVKVSNACADRDGDVEETVTRKKRLTPPVAPKVTGEVEARLIAQNCSTPSQEQRFPKKARIKCVPSSYGVSHRLGGVEFMSGHDVPRWIGPMTVDGGLPRCGQGRAGHG